MYQITLCHCILRDITGHAPNIRTTEGETNEEATGALRFDYMTTWPNSTKETGSAYYAGLRFSASNVVPVAEDNRPYSIKLLYVIAF